MKKIILILLIAGIAAGGYWYMTSKDKAPADPEIRTYRNANLGISFSYPKILTASTTLDHVTLHHEIPYENTGGCDMTGEEELFPTLTDFDVKMRMINKNIAGAMKEVSPYIPEENFVNGEVVESPGFIDAYSVGKYQGYAIYEGAEGCGQTAYYLRVSSNKTLVITKASIQALSGVRSPEVENEILAVPGVISRQQSEAIFTSILESLEAQ